MTDQEWDKETRWHRVVNACSLSVREMPRTRIGEWQWSVNRYPDVHEKGTAATRLRAMKAAMMTAENSSKRAA